MSAHSREVPWWVLHLYCLPGCPQHPHRQEIVRSGTSADGPWSQTTWVRIKAPPLSCVEISDKILNHFVSWGRITISRSTHGFCEDSMRGRLRDRHSEVSEGSESISHHYCHCSPNSWMRRLRLREVKLLVQVWFRSRPAWLPGHLSYLPCFNEHPEPPRRGDLGETLPPCCSSLKVMVSLISVSPWLVINDTSYS